MPPQSWEIASSDFAGMLSWLATAQRVFQAVDSLPVVAAVELDLTIGEPVADSMTRTEVPRRLSQLLRPLKNRPAG